MFRTASGIFYLQVQHSKDECVCVCVIALHLCMWTNAFHVGYLIYKGL